MRNWIAAGGLLAAAVVFAGFGTQVSRAAELTTPGGPTEALRQQAKTEGSVVWYTSNSPTAVRRIADEAEKQLGFKITVVRLTSSALFQRVQQEFAQQTPSADVIDTSDASQVMVMKKAGILQPFSVTTTKNYRQGAADFDPEMYWYNERIIPLNIVYNTKLITGDMIPKSWKDLENPKYKNKLIQANAAAAATALGLTQGVVRTLGWSFYDAMKANNVQTVSTTNFSDQLLSGERPIGLGTISTIAAQIARGDPLGAVFPSDGTFGTPAQVVVTARAAHPAAAAVFANWILSPAGQQEFVNDGSASPFDFPLSYPPPYGNLWKYDIKSQTVDEFLKTAPEVRARFTQMFGG